MQFRKSIALSTTLILAILVAQSTVVSAQTVQGSRLSLSWSSTLAGWNRSSSPVIADIDADGHNEIVFGHQDGKLRAYEGDGSLKWVADAVPGNPAMCHSQSSGSAIDSSPAVADIDDDGDPEVVVGVGSAWVRNQNGSVISFDGKTGAIEWSFDQSRDTGNIWDGTTPNLDGWCEATYATPAIGDVDGDGAVDVVFGSWDFYIWAINGNGKPLPGFPINNDDTIWSSPALFDGDNDGDVEIYFGGDSTPGGGVDHLGGIFRAIDYRNGAPVVLWTRRANEVFHSSPAIGDINGDGRPEAITGMGDNWHIECGERNNRSCSRTDGTDHVKVWAFHLDDGSDVPGWPRSTSDTTLVSPALGDVDGDGVLEVVAGSHDHNVYVWNGDGSLLWRSAPRFGHFGTSRVTGSPIIADLDGDGDQDIAVGSDTGMAFLDGRNGSPLHMSVYGQSHEAAAAVGFINGSRHIVFTSFNTPGEYTVVSAYRLPATSAEDAWPMFRHSAERRGAVPTNVCGNYLVLKSKFCDVPNGVYYTDAVTWMVENEITTGVTKHLFGPAQTLTRAQIVTFLWRQAGRPDSDGDPPHGFIDVPTGTYYHDAVRWAKANKVVEGTTTTTFSPTALVTRGQLIALLWRQADRPAPDGDPPHGFIDVPTDAFYHDAVRWAKAVKITQGITSTTTFLPDEPATRAVAAGFLYRAVQAG